MSATQNAPAAAQNVPATVQSVIGYSAVRVVVGEQYFGPPQQITNGYWYLVLDLTTLKSVLNVTSTSNTEIPASLAPYVNNPQYFLFFTSVNLRMDNVPQGNLYRFLTATGAGVQLVRAEQINEQLGTGTFGRMCYVLAATLNQHDAGGFEEMSVQLSTILTFQFLPVVVDGKTIYAPITIGI